MLGYQYCHIAGADVGGCPSQSLYEERDDPIRLPGPAYVAFARVKSPDGFARRGLPSLSKFLQRRENTHHKRRVEYEVRMGDLREEFMRFHGISPNEERERTPQWPPKRAEDEDFRKGPDGV